MKEWGKGKYRRFQKTFEIRNIKGDQVHSLFLIDAMVLNLGDGNNSTVAAASASDSYLTEETAGHLF